MNPIAGGGLLVVIVSGLLIIDVVWDWLRRGNDPGESKASHEALMRELRRHP